MIFGGPRPKPRHRAQALAMIAAYSSETRTHDERATDQPSVTLQALRDVKR